MCFKKTSMIVISLSVVIVAACIVCYFVIRLNGSSTIVTGSPSFESSKSLVCTSNSFKYPFFEYDNASWQSTELNMIFANNKISSISLTHKMQYATEALASTSSSTNHASMNKSFARDNYRADALNANYNVNDNIMRMTIFTDILDNTNRKYFLINDIISDFESYRKNYVDLGFNCSVNE